MIIRIPIDVLMLIVFAWFVIDVVLWLQNNLDE